MRLALSAYRIRHSEAEDVVQSTFVTYLEVRHRYPAAAEHPAILVGILRYECLGHIRGTIRTQRKLQRYCETPDAARENVWIRPKEPAQTRSVLDELVHSEVRGEICEAIERLRPSSRRIAKLIAIQGFGRKELIDHFSVNRNTLDSRLRACRLELLALLRERGVAG